MSGPIHLLVALDIYMTYKIIIPILIIFSCVYGENGIRQIRLKSDLNHIEGVISNERILFAADSDDSGCVHLVYIVERGAFFLKFHPKQNSSSSSIKLSVIPGNSPYKRFFLFTKKQKDYFFWWEKGLNRLLIDSSEKDLKSVSNKVLPSIPVADFTLTNTADKLWLSYSNQNGIFIRKSSDWGQSWSKIILVYSFSGNETPISVPKLTNQQNNLYLTFSIFNKKTELDSKTKLSPSNSKIILLKGDNKGENWSQLNIGETLLRNSTVFQNPQIFCQQNVLHLFYDERGIHYQHSEQNRLHFNPPVAITKTTSSFFKVHTYKEGFLLLWIDTYYRKKEWWAHIPLHQIFTWDKDPYRANNDLFLMYYSKEKTKEYILSPQNSFAVPSQSSVKLLESESNIIILWSGLSKIGKTLNDRTVPYLIFYRILSKNKFF